MDPGKARGEQTAPVLEDSSLEWVRQGIRIRDLLERTASAREAFELAQGGDESLHAPVEVEDVVVGGGRWGQTTVRLFRPWDSQWPLPVVVYAHGPGFALGSCATHDRLMRVLARGGRVAVALVDYELAPEARYPQALEQCHAAACWVMSHGPRHGLDPERIVVAGDSAGANLVIALTLLAKERGGPRYRGQLLLCPWCDSSSDWPSYRQLGDRYPWGATAVQWFWRSYLPDGQDRSVLTICPVRAEVAQLAELPPALVITAEADVARDEAEAYAAKLRAAGVPTTALRYQGTVADFAVIDALCESGSARSATACASAFLRERLGGEAG